MCVIEYVFILHAITCSVFAVLILHGADDKIVPFSESQRTVLKLSEGTQAELAILGSRFTAAWHGFAGCCKQQNRVFAW
jgi:dipeptidyl aminopeptidase/acylaminoacyl peptidase